MSNINIDISSTPQNVDVNVSPSIQTVGIVVSEFRGRSAYQVWLDEGNVGTVDDFFASILNTDTSSFDARYERIGTGIISGSSQIILEDISGFSDYSQSVDLRLVSASFIDAGYF